jgi:hypothetical protein
MKRMPASSFLLSILGLVLLTLVLSPLLESGYYGDDSLNAFVLTLMKENHQSLWGLYKAYFEVFAGSRLSFFQLYHWTFMIFTKLISLKIYVLVLVLIGSYLFSKLIFILTRSREIAYLSFLVLAVVIQFRSYGDPILVFHGLGPIHFIFVIGSLLQWQYFLMFRLRRHFFWSFLLFLLANMMYELSYPLFMAHFFMSFYFNKKRERSFFQSFKSMSPFLAVSVTLGLTTIIVREFFFKTNDIANTLFHSAYKPNQDPFAVILCLVKQIYATVPLSYYFSDPNSLFGKNNILPFNTIFFQSVALVSTAALFIYLAGTFSKELYRLENEDSNDNLTGGVQVLFGVGFSLLVLPSFLLALSPKYQSEILWGLAYTPVYIASFGMSFLILGVLYYLRHKFKDNSRLFFIGSALFAGCAIATVLLNYRNNKVVVISSNTFWHHPRTILEQALENGLISEVRDNSYLFIDSNFPWDIKTFVRAHSGKIFDQGQYHGGRSRFLYQRTRGSLLLTSEAKDNASVNPTGLELPSKSKVLLEGFKGRFFDNFYFEFPRETTGSSAVYLDYYSDGEENGYALFSEIQNLLLSNDLISGVASRKVRIYLRTPLATGGYRSLTIAGNYLEAKTLRSAGTFLLNESMLKQISVGSNWKLLELATPNPGLLVDPKSIVVSNISKFVQPSFFWKPLPSHKMKFPTVMSEVLHFGTDTTFLGGGISLSPIELRDQFTIQLIVQPEADFEQANFAHILGNHPGLHNFEGFAIQRVYQDKERYFLGYGDGATWQNGGDFTLPSGRKSYVAICFDRGTVRIFSDGRFSPPKILPNWKASSLPLMIGNFVNGDRPFHGTIPEVQILNEVLPDKMILDNWKRAK